MLRILALSLIALLSAEASAEVLTIEKRSHTIDGVTSHYHLEVEIEDIKMSPKLDPAKDELPVSISKAINLAMSKYKENYKSEPWGIASVSLNHFSSRDYKDRWYLKVVIMGKPHVSVVVLFNEKVVFPNKQ